MQQVYRALRKLPMVATRFTRLRRVRDRHGPDGGDRDLRQRAQRPNCGDPPRPARRACDRHGPVEHGAAAQVTSIAGSACLASASNADRL